MEVFDQIGYGLAVALSWKHLLYCLTGVVVGTLIGVLPGIGPAATTSMLLPITYHLGTTESLIRWDVQKQGWGCCGCSASFRGDTYP